MDLFNNIIIICLLGVILLGCSILSKKSDGEIELTGGGNGINDIVVDLPEKDAEKLVELIDNMKESDFVRIDGIPTNTWNGIIIKTSSNKNLRIQNDPEEMYITYTFPEGTAYYKVFNNELKGYLKELYVLKDTNNSL